VNQITAKHLLNTADSLAITLASNARLARIESADIDTTGKSNSWTYVYLSFDTSNIHNSKMYFLIAQNNQVTFDHLAPLGVGPSILNNGWMDSDSALSIAEIAGGSDIRKRFPACTITASLYQWDSPPFISEWQIDYQCSDSIRTIPINATSGEIVTSVKESNKSLPMLFELYQNYPNPFNPNTVIRYQLSVTSQVDLKVYDVLGRVVKTLVHGIQKPGVHAANFDGSCLSSGVYFYQLATYHSVLQRTMVLIK